MNKWFVDQQGCFWYGDQPNDRPTREATPDEVAKHHLSTAKASKTADIKNAYFKYIQDVFLSEEQIAAAKKQAQTLCTNIDNATSLADVDAINFKID